VNAPDTAWGQRFPRLFLPAHVGYANSDVEFVLGPVDHDLVARLHLVAVTADHRVLVSSSREGWRFLPGGTREPGESVHDLAVRELLEEAGASLVGELDLFGAHVSVSRNVAPYRSHLPHPRALWAYAVCRAEIVGPPTCPPGGEQIVDVQALAPAEAAAYLSGHDPLLADVLDLAVALGRVPSHPG